MKKIPVSGGKAHTLVDDSQYDFLMQWKWHQDEAGYVRRHGPGNHTLRMARVIMNAEKGQYVDHINHDILDNRRCNLRVCSSLESTSYRRKSLKTGSPYKGVTWDSKSRAWRTRIGHKYRSINLGLFRDPKLAAMRYNYACIILHGDFASLNIL